MKLGILNATRKASVPALAPNASAITKSRTKPSKRDKNVKALTVAVARNSLRVRKSILQ
jgi:hypothetical protein